MANPKRKISRSKRDMRRAQWANLLKSKTLVKCDHCGEQKLPHHACPACGYHKGKSVFIPKSA
ncbi:MAG: 50S ribosomal protein L32 [Calditrichaceae bacterium]